MSTKQTQTTEIMETTWEALTIHHQLQALFLVCPPVTLPIVTQAIATDQTRVISAWLNSKHIFRPDDEYVKKILPTLKFQFAIVQPYVLVQLDSNPSFDT